MLKVSKIGTEIVSNENPPLEDELGGIMVSKLKIIAAVRLEDIIAFRTNRP